MGRSGQPEELIEHTMAIGVQTGDRPPPAPSHLPLQESGLPPAHEQRPYAHLPPIHAQRVKWQCEAAQEGLGASKRCVATRS